jgi:hypothetical protein
MATASFNTKITAPNIDGEQNTYDLTTILTLSGFDLESISFRLSEKYKNIGVSTNTLTIYYGAYGNFSIIVEDRLKNSTTATTNIEISYGGAVQKMVNSSNFVNSYNNTKTNWSTIIG